MTAGDTLAVLDSEAIELARQKLFNLIKEKEELRRDPSPASQQKALLAAQHGQAGAERHFGVIRERYELGYASSAELGSAAGALDEATAELRLMTQDQQRLQTERAQKLRDLQEQIDAARLRLKETSGEHVITTHLAGRVMHIELRSVDGDKSQVRVLLSTDEKTREELR